MNRGAVNNVSQIGIEVTSGTAVNANKFTPTLAWKLMRDRGTKKFRARGSKVDSTHVLHKSMAKGTVDGVLDYNSFPYILENLIAADTPEDVDSGGTVYQRVYKPGVRAADSTGKTYTVEQGDATACEDYAYTKVVSLDIESGQDDFTVKGGLISRYPADGQTLTSSPTVVPERPVERNDINLYIDTDFASIGTTLVTEALEESLSLSDKFKEFFVHNRTAGEFYDIVEIPYEPTFKFATVHNAQSRTLIAALTANPYRWIRWEAQGALLDTISSTPYYELIRIDMCVKFDTPETIDDEDGPLGYRYNCTMMPDDDGIGSYMEITSINGIASL